MTTWSWGDIVAPSLLRLLFPYLLDSKHKVTTNIFFFGRSACRIFPDQGQNPSPLHWEHRVLATDCQGSPQNDH